MWATIAAGASTAFDRFFLSIQTRPSSTLAEPMTPIHERPTIPAFADPGMIRAGFRWETQHTVAFKSGPCCQRFSALSMSMAA